MGSPQPEKSQTKEKNPEMTTIMKSTDFDKMSLSDSDDDFPEIECKTCCKTFSSVNMYQQHLNSKKHYQMITKIKLMQKLGKGAPNREEAKKDDDINSDSNEGLYCEVCDKEISGYIPYMAHMKGLVHAKNLKQNKLKEKLRGMKEFQEDESHDIESDEDGIFEKPFAQCSVCQKTFHGPESYEQHMNGANHKKKLRHMKVIDSLKKDMDQDNENEDDETFTKCEICNKAFSGPVPYKIHLKSLVHEKELKRVEAEKELKDFFLKDSTGEHLICKECQKNFPDAISFKFHLANNSHGKKKVKDEMFGFVASNPDIVAVKSVQNISSDEESEDKENFQNGHYFLVCKLCHMSFSGPESAQDHLKSKNHLKIKKEKAERKMLKERMKQNERPSTDGNDIDGSNTDGHNKKSTGNGDKTVLSSVEKAVDLSHALNADDFEFI